MGVGTTPLRHLLTLEQQVIFVKSHFRMHDSNLWEHLRSPESFWFHWWAQEAHEHFIGPCSIDSQVRRKLILEQPPILRHRIIENQRYRESALPRIIKLGMGVKPGDLERIDKLQMVYEKLLVLSTYELTYLTPPGWTHMWFRSSGGTWISHLAHTQQSASWLQLSCC